MGLQERDFQVTGRSATLSRKGIASSASPLAAQEGAYVMKQGGNAFDAAIAMAAVEGVVCTPFCGLGGEVFALLYEASSGKVYGVTGSGRAPQNTSISFFTERGFQRIPNEGALASVIPGEVDALWSILKRFGSGRYTFAQLLEPAIEYAEGGFPVPQRLARYFRVLNDRIVKYPHTAAYLMNNGETFRPGQVMVQKNLARTLRRVAEGGPDEFYRGDVGRELIKALQEEGALYTFEELGDHVTEIYEDPAFDSYRGDIIYETKLPSQGAIVLQMMNMLEQFDVAGIGFNTADYIHLLAEVRHKAFADLDAYYGDPEFVHVPLDALLSKDYAKVRAQEITMNQAANQLSPGVLERAVGDGGSTTYFCVADQEGNLVSFIHSLYGQFGSCFIPGDLGFLMNNRATTMSLREGGANSLMPGKKPLHTLNCFIVFREGRPFLVGGTPGGPFQPQWNVQSLTRVLDFGMDVQQAVEEPRIIALPPGFFGTTTSGFEMHVEDKLLQDGSLVRALEAKGHTVLPYNIPSAFIGCAHLIGVDPTAGIFMGAADPREDGLAIGY